MSSNHRHRCRQYNNHEFARPCLLLLLGVNILFTPKLCCVASFHVGGVPSFSLFRRQERRRRDGSIVLFSHPSHPIGEGTKNLFEDNEEEDTDHPSMDDWKNLNNKNNNHLESSSSSRTTRRRQLLTQMGGVYLASNLLLGTADDGSPLCVSPAIAAAMSSPTTTANYDDNNNKDATTVSSSSSSSSLFLSDDTASAQSSSSSSSSPQTIVITGANSGIGYEACKRLISQPSGGGHTLVLACRTQAKANDTVQRLQQDLLLSSSSSSTTRLIPAECNLASLAPIQQFAQQQLPQQLLKSSSSASITSGGVGGGATINALCLNAGIARNTAATDVARTEDGFELTGKKGGNQPTTTKTLRGGGTN